MSNRRTATQITADRTAALALFVEGGAKRTHRELNALAGTEVRQSDLDALVKEGKLVRTVREEYDTVYSPHFGNGQNVACKRRRAQYALPEAAPATAAEEAAPTARPNIAAIAESFVGRRPTFTAQLVHGSECASCQRLTTKAVGLLQSSGSTATKVGDGTGHFARVRRTV